MDVIDFVEINNGDHLKAVPLPVLMDSCEKVTYDPAINYHNFI